MFRCCPFLDRSVLIDKKSVQGLGIEICTDT